MAVYEIPDFRKRGGEPQLVTVVPRDEIDKFLGARDRHERQEHLRELRDRGMLVVSRGRLQQKIRCSTDRKTQEMAYVFRGPASRVPKIGKGHMAGGVLTWR